MGLADDVQQGEPLAPRLAQIAEWIHRLPDPRIDQAESQTLVEGARLFIAAAADEDPSAFIAERLEGGRFRSGATNVAASLLNIWRGVPVDADDAAEPQQLTAVSKNAQPDAVSVPEDSVPGKRGPKPGSHHGIDDKTWWDTLASIDGLRRANVPWEAIGQQYPRWSERTLREWLREYRQRNGQ